MPVRTPSDVLEFWFSDQSRALWFEKNAAFDKAIRSRFEDTVRAAADGELEHWERTAPGALALVIALDQFPRNLYRGSARAFAADARARDVTDRAINRGQDQETALDRRFFFYTPFEHSELLADQERSIALFQDWVDAHDRTARNQAQAFMPYIHRHEEIISVLAGFRIVTRPWAGKSTEAEIAFLREPMSAF